MGKSKKKIKFNSFMQDGLSIDESRVSVLIATYLISFLVTLGYCVYTKDVESMKAIFFSTIAAVTGINVTNSIMNSAGKKDDQQDTVEDDSEIKG
jgi:Kef-type K+ transport system membrane component KefB